MRPQNSINLNFKSNYLHICRLLERRIIIPFHEKICSWCHSIPHAKVFKLDKTAAILELNIENIQMMQEWLKAEILDGVNIFYTGACQILRILPEQNTSQLFVFLLVCKFSITTWAQWFEGYTSLIRSNKLQKSNPDQQFSKDV